MLRQETQTGGLGSVGSLSAANLEIKNLEEPAASAASASLALQPQTCARPRRSHSSTLCVPVAGTITYPCMHISAKSLWLVNANDAFAYQRESLDFV